MQFLDDSDEDFESVIKSECVQDLPKKAPYVLKVIFECKVLVKYVQKGEFITFSPRRKYLLNYV